jgi:DNA (cytosine-5)-methyltransferase 1
MNNLTMKQVNDESSKELFKVVSLFAGGGGSSTGYRLAGGKVLAINEFVTAAQETYADNYGDTHIFKGDIRDLTAKNILDKIGMKKGELDILDGSPPCSGFSAIGLREEGWGKVKKYSDTEQVSDDLFFEFARILDGVQPKVFVCENVKGITQGASKKLLGDEQYGLFGEHENTIIHTLAKCGYNVRYKVLNAKDFSVPQSRERTIFIGVRKDIDANPTFPLPSKQIVGIGQVIPDIDYISCGAGFGESKNRVITPEKPCYTILEDGVGANRRYRVARKGMNLESIPEKHRKLYYSMENFDGVNYIKDEEYQNDSRLTIQELKLICGFPTDYILTGSYSKQWERLGRAVPPIMMCEIAKHIYQNILKKVKVRECKYCNNEATMAGYRGNNGNVSKEIVCGFCNSLETETLNLKSIPYWMKEGEDYWGISEIDSDCPIITKGIWSKESASIGNKDIFKELDNAKKYLNNIGKKIIHE